MKNFKFLIVALVVSSCCFQAVANPEPVNSERDKLELEFGKFCSSFKNFEVYGVKLKEGSRDGARGSDGTKLSTLTGTIVSPTGLESQKRSFAAEVKTDKGIVVKCTTSDNSKQFSFNLKKGAEFSLDKSKSTGRQITKFDWVVPSNSVPSTLHLTSVAK